MRAILVGAYLGKGSSFKKILSHLRLGAKDLRVGIDGGILAWQRVGRMPHFAVGDWDSLGRRDLLQKLIHLTLPTQKNRSDLYYGCRAAAHLGATELVCVGVTGGRPDHHLAAILELSEIAKKFKGRVQVKALDGAAEYVFLSGPSAVWTRPAMRRGQLVSIFALGGPARGVSLSGFKYPLRRAQLIPSSRGLSNVAHDSQVCVSVRHGSLVIVLPC